MTTIHLTENLERFIRDAVNTGRYGDESEVISDALIRLKRSIDFDVDTSSQSDEPGAPGKKLTKQEFQRHLVKIGLLDRPAEPGADSSDGLVDSGGEIVDEVVIRERLIEWLTGFLNS